MEQIRTQFKTDKHFISDPVLLQPIEEVDVTQQQDTVVSTQTQDLTKNVTNIKIGLAFFLGLFIGLVILGWNVWPVEYTSPRVIDYLPSSTKSLIVTTVGDNLTYSGDSNYAKYTMDNLSNNPNNLICDLLTQTVDEYNRAVLLSLQFQLTGANYCG